MKEGQNLILHLCRLAGMTMPLVRHWNDTNWLLKARVSERSGHQRGAAMSSDYDKAVFIATVHEDGEKILATLNGASLDDAANALAFSIAVVFAKYRAEDRIGLLNFWFECSVRPALASTIPPAGRGHV